MYFNRIVIIGFPSSGKTTIGRLLAEKLGLEFIDLDKVIEKEQGMSIEKIFAEYGEDKFREFETDYIKQLKPKDNCVIATGGGAVVEEKNFHLLCDKSLTISLDISLQNAKKRLDENNINNPVFRNKSIDELYIEREHIYKKADINIDCNSGELEPILHNILFLIRPVKLHLNTPHISYPIMLGINHIHNINSQLSHLSYSKAAIFCDEKMASIYGDYLEKMQALITIPSDLFIIKSGEKNKNLATVGNIYTSLLKKKYDRDTIIIGFGGGLIGDIAGFVAATYLRGVKYIHVPTTALAMVDSAIGGKVGVNLPEGKNLVGSFYQPENVMTDLILLKTLEQREYIAGLIETVKHAIVYDSQLFNYIESNINNILNKKLDVLKQVIEQSIKVKLRIIEQDLNESNLRMSLNLGHTVGHAIEKMTNYKSYLHGEAVGYGILIIAKIAAKLGFMEYPDFQRIKNLLRKFNIELQNIRFDEKALIRNMQNDKKIRLGKLHLIIPKSIGEVAIVNSIGFEELEERIRQCWEI